MDILLLKCCGTEFWRNSNLEEEDIYTIKNNKKEFFNWECCNSQPIGIPSEDDVLEVICNDCNTHYMMCKECNSRCQLIGFNGMFYIPSIHNNYGTDDITICKVAKKDIYYDTDISKMTEQILPYIYRKEITDILESFLCDDIINEICTFMEVPYYIKTLLNYDEEWEYYVNGFIFDEDDKITCHDIITYNTEDNHIYSYKEDIKNYICPNKTMIDGKTNYNITGDCGGYSHHWRCNNCNIRYNLSDK